MSWHFSAALAEAYSRRSSADGKQSAPLKSTSIVATPSSRDKKTDTSRPSPSGATSEHSTASPGEDLLTWYREDFLANHSAPRPAVATSLKIYGQRCIESSERLSLATSSLKTFRGDQSNRLRSISLVTVTKFASLKSLRPSWVRRICGDGGGWLPTPTAKANLDAKSMRKWPAYASYQDWLHGAKTSPEIWEWFMGWPIGWTDSTPLAMDRWQQWQQWHGISCDDKI